MFGSFANSAQRFLGGLGQGAVNGIANLGKAEYNAGAGVYNAAKNFFNPAQPAQAQTTSQPIAPQPQAPFMRPQQTNTVVPAAGLYKPAAIPQAYGQSTQPTLTPEEAASRYATAIAPYQQQISSYLATRNPQSYLQSQLDQTGATALGKTLGGYEGDISNLQDQLKNAPAADIARRQDNSTLTAAQRYRLQQTEEEPIRKNLDSVQQGYQTAQLGYNRALQLAQTLAGNYGDETSQNVGQMQGNIGNISGILQKGYAQEASPSGLPTGAITQQQEALQQQAQEQQLRELTGSLAQEVRNGATLQQMMGKYIGLGLPPDTILSLYNASSKRFGPAKESGEVLTQRYGVTPGRYPTLK